MSNVTVGDILTFGDRLEEAIKRDIYSITVDQIVALGKILFWPAVVVLTIYSIVWIVKELKPVADVSKPKPDTVSHVRHEPAVESIKRTCPCASGQLKNDRHIMVEGYVNCDGCMWPTYTKYYASLYYSLKTGDMNSKGQAWNGDRWVDQQNQGDVS